jgi:Na+-transporting NADH:ubiquinone oxidoreductase subunit C
VVLPVWTKGLYSTLRGFLALRGDGNTIQGLTFYEDGETPGLGGEINNPRWQARWQDKEVYGDEGDILITVTKNASDPAHDIDALAGATLTSRGVDNMMKFWMGEAGYGPFLANLRSGGISL